jgi:hypothetical protein
MGGSSVPSSTTQTTMLDPTRQAALKKSIGYFDKWADSYNGPTYKGPLTAGRTSDWYTAQSMAHNMAKRFAEGGITSVRRFPTGGEITTGGSPDTLSGGTTNDTLSGGATNDTVTGGNYTPAETSANMGNPYTVAQGYVQSGIGGTLGLAKIPYTLDKLTNTYTNPDTLTPGTLTNTYNSPGSVSVDKITNTYKTPTELSLDKVANAYTDPNSVTLGKITNTYVNPAQFTNTSNISPESWSRSAMDTYMSPYTQGVVDIALREADRQRAIELQNQKAAATQAGAFGGYRQGVVEAEGNRNYDISRNDITSKGYADAYANAQGQFNVDRTAKTDAQKFNAQNALDAFIANQSAQQKAAEFGMNAESLNATNTYNSFTANEAAKQKAAQMALDADTTNATNAYNTFKANEDTKQKAAQMAMDATKASNTDTLSAFTDNEAAKQKAADLDILAGNYNNAAALTAFTANEAAKQKAADMALSTDRYNNDATRNSYLDQLAAYQQAIASGQGLGALETAKSNDSINTQNQLTNLDAGARSAQQALIEALQKQGVDLSNVDLAKFQALVSGAGVGTGNNSNVQVKTSGNT